jgi:hypothetical protein
VAYLETSELFRRLELNPNTLVWQQLVPTQGPLQAAQASALYTASPPAARDAGAGFAMAIAEAKRKLAESLGIASEKIEITIRL